MLASMSAGVRQGREVTSTHSGNGTDAHGPICAAALSPIGRASVDAAGMRATPLTPRLAIYRGRPTKLAGSSAHWCQTVAFPMSAPTRSCRPARRRCPPTRCTSDALATASSTRGVLSAGSSHLYAERSRSSVVFTFRSRSVQHRTSEKAGAASATRRSDWSPAPSLVDA